MHLFLMYFSLAQNAFSRLNKNIKEIILNSYKEDII